MVVDRYIHTREHTNDICDYSELEGKRGRTKRAIKSCWAVRTEVRGNYFFWFFFLHSSAFFFSFNSLSSTLAIPFSIMFSALRCVITYIGIYVYLGMNFPKEGVHACRKVGILRAIIDQLVLLTGKPFPFAFSRVRNSLWFTRSSLMTILRIVFS